MDARRTWTSWWQGLVTGLMFWTMFLVGSVSFGATLLIPAWLDYVDARANFARRIERNEALQQRQTIVENQLAHHAGDAFYQARYAEDELNFHTRYYEDRETIAAPEPAAKPDAPPLSVIPGDVPELVEATEQMRQPQGALAIFVLPQARPAILVLSAVLVAGSLVMLSGRDGWAPQKHDASAE